jgi:hypothetical protein
MYFRCTDGIFTVEASHKAKIFGSQIIQKSMEARKPKGLNRIAKFG